MTTMFARITRAGIWGKAGAGAAVTVTVLLMTSGMGFADTGPTFYAGQTACVFTNPGNGTQFSLGLFSEDGGLFNTTVPLTYVGQITGNFAPTWSVGWGTTWDEFCFVVPPGETAGHSYGAMMMTPAGGGAFTRFVGFPDPTAEYGTQYTFAGSVAAGQLPEVPYAAALPVVAGVGGLWLARRRRRFSG
jgi:hypothetical protein